ncbi:MAG: ACP S-malonyltransferase [Bacteroidales bacterium]|nr:ACP S-malonyltransferase [Bacteroidales bacterium]
MKAYVFPGQGAQFIGMGKELYESRPAARELFERANTILEFRITDIMFAGSEEELKMTKVTQPAVFLHSVIEFLTADGLPSPDMVAGHSLGEFSALVANRTLDFEDALKLVSQRALAMQKACELRPSTMAAILKFDDQKIEEVCASITEEVVVTANYNSPGQLVISGSVEGVDLAIQKLREIGARRVLPLNVGGAFHSPLMQSAQEELAAAIEQTNFHEPICPIYQNISAQGTTDVATIQQNLKDQLTHPVRWTQSVQQMVADGATEFVEFGPGEVLCGLVRRIAPEVSDGVRHI